MAEVTEIVAEAAEGVAEQALGVAEASRGLTGREVSLIISSMTSGIAAGAALAVVLMRRKFETKYNQIAEEEIAGMREHYRAKQMVADGKPELETIVEKRGYSSPLPKREMPEVKPDPPSREDLMVSQAQRNIFDKPDDHWDYEAEVASRSEDAPYIIHVDERGEKEDYTKTTLTYYAGDDILCDEENKVIENQEMLVGASNLDKFGHGSNDPHLVYIRNEYMALEIEVVRSEKTYAEEVHGFKHSDYPRRRQKFDDE